MNIAKERKSRFKVLIDLFFFSPCNALPELEVQNAVRIPTGLHLYHLINCGQGSRHFVDNQVYTSTPLITHLQLPLEHPHLVPLLSLKIQHMQNRIDHFSSLSCLSALPPATHLL